MVRPSCSSMTRTPRPVGSKAANRTRKNSFGNSTVCKKRKAMTVPANKMIHTASTVTPPRAGARADNFITVFSFYHKTLTCVKPLRVSASVSL